MVDQIFGIATNPIKFEKLKLLAEYEDVKLNSDRETLAKINRN